MARPSLKAEKAEEILQAYERCIANYGVEGATLQKVASEAGMARPLLRHYVGNQEELLEQSIERYFTRQQEALKLTQQIDSVDELLDSLFSTAYLQASDGAVNDIMIASAFTLAAQDNEHIKYKMESWFSQVVDTFKGLLMQLYDNARRSDVDVVAVGVVGIYFNLHAMYPVNSSSEFISLSKKSAECLLQNLSSDNQLIKD